MKIHEGQEYAPRLEPTAPIRLADRNHAHYPSRHCTILRKRRLDDGLQAHALSILTAFSFQFEFILFELLGGRSSQPSDWLPFGEEKKVRAHLGGTCVKSTCNIFR